MRFALLAIAVLGAGCSGKKSERSPRTEVAQAPIQQDSAGDAGAPKPPVDAAPVGAAAAAPGAARVDPIASRFRRHYLPDESLAERMRRRIRYQLRGQTKAPIALPQIIRIPQANGASDVFAVYQYSVYEDCVLGAGDRAEARKKCGNPPPDVLDEDRFALDPYNGRNRSVEPEDLNRACVTLGVVRAHFEPPAPGVPDDAGGTLTIQSRKLAETLCEVYRYDHFFVADLDGDERPELYIDITTAQETVYEFEPPRSGQFYRSVAHHFEQHLYVYDGDDADGMALSIALGGWEHGKMDHDELIELRDVNQDRRLDIIQKDICISVSLSKGTELCDGKPRRQAVYRYDAEKDEWTPMKAAQNPVNGSAQAPANGSAQPPSNGSSEPAKAPSGGTPKAP
jgi:hypothetical protein